jgi:imidazolonepropionase-like amidohydrolase
MFRRTALFVLSLLLVLFSIPLCAQTVAVRAGHLIDPATGTVANNQIILVSQGKITAVGPQVEIPKDAQVVDLSQAWVMPGLMDAHTHLTLGGSPGGAFNLEADYLKESSALRALRGLHNATDVLMDGFTAIRDVGNEADFAGVDLRRALQRGWFPGPTLLTAGKIIAPFGGQSHNIPHEQGPYWRFEYLDADTPDEVRKAVREDIYYGATVIKLVADNSRYYYSREEIAAAAEEAHRAGLALAVHVMGGEAARNVILGGADSIEHGFDLSDELLRLMKEKGMVLAGTEFPAEHLKAMGYSGGAQSADDLGKKIIDRLHRAYQIGVKMAFSTDTVVDLPNKTRGDMMLDYLDVWTAAGVPPAEILKAMTTNCAQLLRIEKQRGAIAPGLAADIIATGKDPLQDIHALRAVSFVMKNGRIVKHTQ